MAESYFTEFWIITSKGERLYPAMIRNRDTGKVTYRILAKGNNKQSDGREIEDPIEAIRLFPAGNSMRFGCDGRPADNRFTRGSAFIRGMGAATTFKRDNPSLLL